MYEPEGLGDCSPQTRAKPLFFGQKPNFSRRNQQPKNEKKFLIFIKRKKLEFILSAQNPGFLLIITWWGESSKVILQVSIAVFGVLSKNFWSKMAQPPRKNCPYAYES